MLQILKAENGWIVVFRNYNYICPTQEALQMKVLEWTSGALERDADMRARDERSQQMALGAMNSVRSLDS